MHNNTQAQIVTTAQNSRLLELVQNSRKVVHEGQIQICYMPDARIYFVMINTYCQTIFPSTPWVILKSEKGFSLLYPNATAGLNGIFIQKGQEGDAFLNTLQQLVQIIPFENAIQIPQFKQSIQLHCKDIDINPLENNTVRFNNKINFQDLVLICIRQHYCQNSNIQCQYLAKDNYVKKLELYFDAIKKKINQHKYKIQVLIIKKKKKINQ